MGSGRSTLEMVIKDDLSEEMTFKLRLQMGWSLTCRQNSQCRDPEARTSLVCGRKLKKVNATSFREEVEETGGVNHTGP